MFSSRCLGLLSLGTIAFWGGMVVEPTDSHAISLGNIGRGFASVVLGGRGIRRAPRGFGGRFVDRGPRVRFTAPRRIVIAPVVRAPIIVERRRRPTIVVTSVAPPPAVVVRSRRSVEPSIAKAKIKPAPQATSHAASVPSSYRLPVAAAAAAGAAPLIAGQMGDMPSPGAAPAATPNFNWNHNRSVMRMATEAETVRFYYEVPRDGLADLGITPGTLLFEGRVAGGTAFSGNVSTFSRECGPTKFQVTGQATGEGSRLELMGQKPNRDSRCKVVGYRNETLVFELQPK